MMDWRKLRALLEEGSATIDEQGPEEHDPDGATDLDGNRYCLGCELGVKIVALELALDDYLEARTEN